MPPDAVGGRLYAPVVITRWDEREPTSAAVSADGRGDLGAKEMATTCRVVSVAAGE